MEEPAKQAFCEELGLTTSENGSLDEVLVDWMGRELGVNSESPQEVEHGVLLWLAARLGITGVEALPVDELEAAVRRKVADDSHDFLFPFMELGSAVAYIGPRTVVGPKLEFLESATAGLIPSHSARDRMRKYWHARGEKLLAYEGNIEVEALVELLQEPLDILRVGSESTRASVLTLGFAVALADGRFEVEEEQFLAALARELNLTTEKADQIAKEVKQAFWKHLAAIGGGTTQERSTAEELALTLRAAQLSLESCGSLASFSDVVERGFVGTLHSSLSGGSRFARKMKKWSKAPLRLPLGFATGMLCYIRDKWNQDDHETLLRLSLAAIYRQHLEATADHAEITHEDLEGYMEERRVDNPADLMADTLVGSSEKQPAVRRISLEPTKWP
jgi:hypothetical protein